MIKKIKKKVLGPLDYQSKLLTQINKKLYEIEKKIDNENLFIDAKGIFSIVSSCYNVEDYLEIFLNSIIVSKNIDFYDIEIILVDDGSTDNTAKICKEFERKFKNIKYIYKNNGGAASGRNLGLEYVTNKWVTFIDPDDQVSENYFYQIYKAMKNTQSLMYCGNLIYYIEETGEHKDEHPMNYKFDFEEEYKEVDIIKQFKYFQLSSSSAFVLMDLIKLWDLRFDETVKLAFEDAIFLTEYIVKTASTKITFSKESIYYYTKRNSNNSQLQIARSNSEKYTMFLKVYDDFLVKMVGNKKYTPYIKHLVYYDIAWNIRDMNYFDIYLNEKDKKIREKYLASIFKNIGFKTISENWNVLWRAYQIGINYRYFGNKESVKAGVYYFSQENEYVIFDLIYSGDINFWKIKSNEIYSDISKFEHHEYDELLNGSYFITHSYIKILKKDLSITEFFYEGIIQQIKDINYYNDTVKFLSKNSKLLFFDRPNMAKDNAEVLYKYFQKNYKSYKYLKFAIKKDSDDWDRLSKLGFNLVDFESKEFYDYYVETDFIFSSSFNNEIENPFNLRAHGLSASKFIFLQHGVITDDMSQRFHFKRFNKFVVSSIYEYENLKNKYTIQNDQILFSGMPRYELLKNEICDKNIILYHPTWRSYLRTPGKLEINEEIFLDSIFYKETCKILENEKLKNLLSENNAIVRFILHPNIIEMKHHFKRFQNDVVEIVLSQDINYTDEFNKCRALITDYSSVFTDVLYLRKTVFFFQPDSDEFFKNHIYKMEMNYKTCGLGDYCSSSEELIKNINIFFLEDYFISEDRKNSIDEFFGKKKNNPCEELLKSLF